MANEGSHEPVTDLSDETEGHASCDHIPKGETLSRRSVQQRVDACEDAELKAILAHNQDEE